MTSNLWLSNSTHRVFGWKQLLADWDTSFQVPVQVKRVQDNLSAATDPDHEHDPHLSQFMTYLNYEQEGIAWFLYECISIRWMFSSVRSSVRNDFIRSLVDEIEELDGYFPRFPGSPRLQTIREFVQENLSADELAYVEMMPPLIAEDQYQTPARSARADYSYAQRAPFPPLRRTSRISEAQVPTRPQAQPQAEWNVPQVRCNLSQQFETLAARKDKKLSIEVRFIRSKENSDDDVVSITQVSADSYNIIYRDKQADVKSKTLAVPRAAVMNFLSMTLRMLTVDEEPFASVQFTLPSMPTILVSPKNLTSQTRDLIYDSVEATMDYWPTRA